MLMGELATRLALSLHTEPHGKLSLGLRVQNLEDAEGTRAGPERPEATLIFLQTPLSWENLLGRGGGVGRRIAPAGVEFRATAAEQGTCTAGHGLLPFS